MSTEATTVESATDTAAPAPVDTFGTGLKASTLELIQQRIDARRAADAPAAPEPVAVPDLVAKAAPVEPVVEAAPVDAPPLPPPVDLVAKQAELDKRQADLDARETKLAGAKPRREVFVDNPVQAMRETVAEFLGVAVDDPTVTEHMLEIVTDFSSEALGIGGSSKKTTDRKVRALSMEMERWKQEQHAAEEQKVRAAEEAKHTEARQSTVVYLDRQIQSAVHTYPALSALPQPGAAILARVEQAAANGVRLNWDEAAKAAETELVTELQRFAPALKLIQQATPATPVVSNSKPPSPPSSISTPTSISTADASTATTTPSEPPRTHEEAIARTIERAKSRRRG